MTKVPVNIPGFTPNVLYGTGRVQETEVKGEFGKILETQKNASTETKTRDVKREEDLSQTQEEMPKDVEEKEPVTAEVNEVEEKEAVQDTSEASMEQSEQEQPDNELMEAQWNLMMPMLQTAIGDVKELLVQELGITPEELDVVMSNMGMTETELLDMDSLKELLLQVNGTEDMTALLTDEDLYAKVQNLQAGFDEIIENVQETLQLDMDEMNQVVEQVSKNGKNNEAPVVVVETVATIENEPEYIVPAETKEDTKGENNQHSFMAPNQNNNDIQQILQHNAEISKAEIPYMSGEAENIMNQIMDYMKIQLSAESDVLEMQLQPESLGTLQIRISAKEGIMTAQFTTASEVVKAVLESQMVQLQQQFNDQNIKVEAIEVTVQTHQFESALQHGEERNQTEEDKKNRTRRIDLNLLEESDEVSEEDRLVAEMMRANGSSVDYLA